MLAEIKLQQWIYAMRIKMYLDPRYMDSKYPLTRDYHNAPKTKAP